MFRLNDDMIIENLTKAAERLKSSQQLAAETNNIVEAIVWVPGAILVMEEAVEELKRRKKEEVK